jgi:hypothetical protein
MDSDILRYEIGFACETAWKGMKFPNASKDNPLSAADKQWLIDNPPPFELAEEMLLNRIAHIETVCEATEPSIYFFTGKTNFRNLIAKKQPYKVRNGLKPFHYYNLTAYMKGNYDCRQEEGLEADDLMAIYQKSRIEDGTTIICTRDKDLRQVSGWHFGWELNNSPQFGPVYIEGYGSIALNEKRELKGVGPKFFLAQCIMGDATDCVPGLEGKGAVAAFEVVGPTTTYEEGLEAVLGAYEAFYGHPVIARDELLEQGRLLYMTRQLNADGSPVLWEF